MTKSNVLEESKDWHDRATRILEESKLRELLGKFGEVELTGSYAYDLMLEGDIDLHLTHPEPTKEQALKVLHALVDQGWWNGYMLFDWVNFHRDYFPSAYYLGMKTDFEETRWKIDIWLLKETPAGPKKYAEKLSRLSPDQKQTILELKQTRNEHRWPIMSTEIYDAVLDKGIQTVTELQALTKKVS